MATVAGTTTGGAGSAGFSTAGCGVDTLMPLPAALFLSSAKALADQPAVQVSRSWRCDPVSVAAFSLAGRACLLRLDFGFIDTADDAASNGTQTSSKPAPPLPSGLNTQAAWSVAFFAAVAAAPAVPGSDSNRPVKTLQAVHAQLKSAVGQALGPLPVEFDQPSFVLVCSSRSCKPTGPDAMLAPVLRYTLRVDALSPLSKVRGRKPLLTRDSELASRLLSTLYRQNTPATEAFALDASVVDLATFAKDPFLQAGLAELALSVNVWLSAMAATSRCGPTPRGPDLLSVGSTCFAPAAPGPQQQQQQRQPQSPFFPFISPGANVGSVPPLPPPAPFGHCAVRLGRRAAVNKWGMLFDVTPRAIFTSASMPEVARPGRALGKALAASDAALDRAAVAFRKLLIPAWAASDLFPPSAVSESEILAVIRSALLATFSAPGTSPAEAWRGVPGGSPLPASSPPSLLASVGGAPAMIVEESQASRPAGLVLSTTEGFDGPGSGQNPLSRTVNELRRLSDMNALSS